MSDFNFSSEGVERPVDNFAPIPVGEYPAMVKETAWEKPRDSIETDPAHLKLTIVIIDGEFKNRQVWKKLHLKDLDQTKQKKAKSSLAQLLDAIGKVSINNTAELCNIPMNVKLTVWKPDNGDAMNVVQSFSAMGKAATPAPATIGQAVNKPWD